MTTPNQMNDGGHFDFALAVNYKHREREQRFNRLHCDTVLSRQPEAPLDEYGAAIPPNQVPAPSEPHVAVCDEVVAFGDHLALDEIPASRQAAFASELLNACQATFPSLIEAMDRRDVLVEMLDTLEQPGPGRSLNLRERRYLAEQVVLDVLRTWQQDTATRRLREAAIALRAAGGDPHQVIFEALPRLNR